MKKVPIINNHNHIKPSLGFIEPSLDLENLLKNGIITLGGGYIKHDDGTTELIEVSILPSFEKFRDKTTEGNK